MKVKFTKMQSLGNDFMVLDCISQTFPLDNKIIKRWADRHRGIGFDQCLVLEKSQSEKIDFFMRVFNADGSEVGQCGNGTRCIARFARAKGLTSKDTFIIATRSISMEVSLHNRGDVTVGFPPPVWGAPYTSPNGFAHTLNVGNPHAVVVVTEDVRQVNVAKIGKQISEAPYFPEQTNVEFMKIISPQRMDLRVYERGCGETNACGSGALAAAAVGIMHYQMENEVEVILPGGSLKVSWPDKQRDIQQTGSAEFVYEGEVEGPLGDTATVTT